MTIYFDVTEAACRPAYLTGAEKNREKIKEKIGKGG